MLEHLSTRELVDDVVNTLPDRGGREIEWVIGTLPTVYADRRLLRQVFANLLGNAVKYTRGRASTRIEVSVTTTPDEHIITVRDNGAGESSMIRLRVLAVEDQRDDVELISAALSAGGVEASIQRVDSSTTLTAALSTHDYDIVLVDFVMPRFDGVRAIQMCRRARPERPIVLLTGAVEEHVAAGLVEHGADDYVMKERLGDLPAIVRRLAARRAAP